MSSDAPKPRASAPGIRINRFFAESGVLTRRDADLAVAAGRVAIDGKTATVGDRVLADSIVTLDGQVVELGAKEPVIIAYHKPAGIECTTNTAVEGNILSAISYPERLFPIGRLDKASEGLVLLTNIADLESRFVRDHAFHDQVFEVTLNRGIVDGQMEFLTVSVSFDDVVTQPCMVKRVDDRRIRMRMAEVTNRQIRRMIADIDLAVDKLRRLSVMSIELGALKPGQWRILTAAEHQGLLKALA